MKESLSISCIEGKRECSSVSQSLDLFDPQLKQSKNLGTVNLANRMIEQEKCLEFETHKGFIIGDVEPQADFNETEAKDNFINYLYTLKNEFPMVDQLIEDISSNRFKGSKALWWFYSGLKNFINEYMTINDTRLGCNTMDYPIWIINKALENLPRENEQIKSIHTQFHISKDEFCSINDKNNKLLTLASYCGASKSREKAEYFPEVLDLSNQTVKVNFEIILRKEDTYQYHPIVDELYDYLICPGVRFEILDINNYEFKCQLDQSQKKQKVDLTNETQIPVSYPKYNQNEKIEIYKSGESSFEKKAYMLALNEFYKLHYDHSNSNSRDDRSTANTYNYIARCFMAQGKRYFSEALRFFEKAINIRKKYDENNDIANLYLNKGVILEARELRNEALLLYIKSKEIREAKLQGKPSKEIANLNLKIGALKVDNRSYFQKAFDIRLETHPDENDLDIANLYAKLGECDYNEKIYGEALIKLKKALTIRKSLQKPNSYDISVVLMQIAKVHLATKHYFVSIETLKEAEVGILEKFGKMSDEIFEFHALMGNILKDCNDLTIADEYVKIVEQNTGKVVEISRVMEVSDEVNNTLFD